MPYYHCSRCQHEFESSNPRNKAVCDWCDAGDPIVLEEYTPLEKMLNDKTGTINMLKKMNKDSGIPVIKVKSKKDAWLSWPCESFGRKTIQKLIKYVSKVRFIFNPDK